MFIYFSCAEGGKCNSLCLEFLPLLKMSVEGCPAGMESDDSEDGLWTVDDDLDDVREKSTPRIDSHKNSNPVTGNQNQNYTKDGQAITEKSNVRMNNNNSRFSSTTDMIDDMRIAVMRNQVNLVKNYLERGYEINAVVNRSTGWTALIYAASCTNPEIVRLLLELKADPNIHGVADMFTALMAACSSRKPEDDQVACVTDLINAKANVNAYDRHHMTALMYASQNGRCKVVDVLVKNKANLDMTDNENYTALCRACSRGHGQVVRLLIENGADVKLVTRDGMTAGDLATNNGYPIIGKLLQTSVNDGDVSSILSQIPEKETSNVIARDKPIKYGDLETFLMGLDLQKFIDVFNEHHIDFNDLIKMTDDDLEKVGIDKLGIRQKILRAAARVHKKDWEKSSIPNLKNKTFITCTDVAQIVTISGKHLSYIDSSVQYLYKQLVKNPEILQLDKDKVDVGSLEDLTQIAERNAEKLKKQLNHLKNVLNKKKGNVENLPVGLITNDGFNKMVASSNQRRWNPLFYKAGFVVAVAGIVTFLFQKNKINLIITRQNPWL